MIKYEDAVKKVNEVTCTGTPYLEVAQFAIDNQLIGAMAGRVDKLRVRGCELIAVYELEFGQKLQKIYSDNGWKVLLSIESKSWTLEFIGIGDEILPF